VDVRTVEEYECSYQEHGTVPVSVASHFGILLSFIWNCAPWYLCIGSYYLLNCSSVQGRITVRNIVNDLQTSHTSTDSTHTYRQHTHFQTAHTFSDSTPIYRQHTHFHTAHKFTDSTHIFTQHTHFQAAHPFTDTTHIFIQHTNLQTAHTFSGSTHIYRQHTHFQVAHTFSNSTKYVIQNKIWIRTLKYINCNSFYKYNVSVNNATLYFIYNKNSVLSGRHVSTFIRSSSGPLGKQIQELSIVLCY
jgi:hypothetical protein